MSSDTLLFGYDGILFQDSVKKRLKEIAELKADVESKQEKLRREMAEIQGIMRLLRSVDVDAEVYSGKDYRT